MTTTTMDALIIGIPTGLAASVILVSFVKELMGSDSDA